MSREDDAGRLLAGRLRADLPGRRVLDLRPRMKAQEHAADRANFLKLLTDRDPLGDVPVAIRVDLPHRYAAVMAPGVTDFDELRYACATFVQNWLAPEVDRLRAHLEWKANQ